MNPVGTTPPVALTVAGVDSAGGAGMHADLRAFAAQAVHGATVVAAVTAQSTTQIHAVHRVPVEVVAAQLAAVTGDLRVRATKTGFLGSAGIIDAIAASADRLGPLVVDPVLVAATGRRLFDDDVTEGYRTSLLPVAMVFTPNRVEAGVLLDRSVDTVADMEAAAVDLCALGAGAVVVKGGDATDEGDEAIDVVADADGVRRLVRPRVATANDHGSGCTFAATVAARLALDDDVPSAIDAAKDVVHRALVGAAGWRLGAGHGPVDVLGWGSGVGRGWPPR